MWTRLVTVPVLLLVTAWACAALWIDGPQSRLVAGVLAAVCAGSVLAALLFVRPAWRSAAAALVPLLVVLAWWFSLAPSNDRDWEPSVARLSRAVIDGDRVTIRNVRDFRYRSETEFDERWEQRSYDLSKLVGADFFLSYWGSPWIAHTIVSWVFEEGPPLAISIETRKEKGESYSALLGFFRQYELYYVVADERDVIGLRTNFRGEDTYLYRLATPPDVARAILLDYLREVNELVREPRWYNALRHNCTTSIRYHAQHVGAGNPFDWRILVNGKLDELGYARGQINTSLPFAELRRRSAISARARSAPIGPRFSERIRQDLPPRPAPPR